MISGLERALEELTQQVAEKKTQFSEAFSQIHQIMAQREVALLADLGSFLTEIAARINERKLKEQLEQLKEETEKKLHANRLNALLQKHLDNKTEMDEILFEHIVFPHSTVNDQRYKRHSKKSVIL